MKGYPLVLAASAFATVGVTGCKCNDCVTQAEFTALKTQVAAVQDDVRTGMKMTAMLYALDTTGHPTCPPRCGLLRDSLSVLFGGPSRTR